MIEILTSLVVLSMISTVILFEWKIKIDKNELPWLEELVKNMKIDTFTTSEWFQVCYYVILGHVSSHGTIVLPRETNHLLFTVTSLIFALTIRSLLLAYMVDNFHRRDYAKSIFRFKRMILGELLGVSDLRRIKCDEMRTRELKYIIVFQVYGNQNDDGSDL
ncbi:uncharacterized protein LOC125501680 [Athalia rosae]|uniref:uncharacterized protein LOC125501680 n=1 Tax=Athalia rosae TaxID=37344 RepID=UPI002033E313|nr:uncharacterized protein LOC125501680 [Athalia rosae]